LLTATSAYAQTAPASYSATSPDGTIAIAVTTDSDQRVRYAITRRGKALIAPSLMGFILTDGINMVRGWTITGADTAKGDDTWEQPWGERRYVRDHYNELTLHLRQSKEQGERLMDVRFRIFDNGVGFRYEMPKQAAMTTMHIADEVTEFDIAPRGTAWWIPGGEWNRYEQVYQKTPIDGVSTAHTPITMRLDDGTHLSFHEAALVDYSAMWFKRADGQKFRTTLAPSGQGRGWCAICRSTRLGARSASRMMRRGWWKTTLS
jgi:alpha-glucosidase